MKWNDHEILSGQSIVMALEHDGANPNAAIRMVHELSHGQLEPLKVYLAHAVDIMRGTLGALMEKIAQESAVSAAAIGGLREAHGLIHDVAVHLGLAAKDTNPEECVIRLMDWLQLPKGVQIQPPTEVAAPIYYDPRRTPPVRDGSTLIAEERLRQIAAEGWTAEHDANHQDDSLVMAAICYASAKDEHAGASLVWPWDRSYWKPKDRVRNLVRSGALIAAELDRLLHTQPQAPAPEPRPDREAQKVAGDPPSQLDHLSDLSDVAINAMIADRIGITIFHGGSCTINSHGPCVLGKKVHVESLLHHCEWIGNYESCLRDLIQPANKKGLVLEVAQNDGGAWVASWRNLRWANESERQFRLGTTTQLTLTRAIGISFLRIPKGELDLTRLV